MYSLITYVTFMIADHNWIRKQILKYFKKLVYKPYPSTTEQKQLEINNQR